MRGTWRAGDADAGAASTLRQYEVDMGDGPGSIVLRVSRFAGTPRAAADADSARFGDCSALQRRTLSDGTVLQLYPADFGNPEKPSQDVVVYQPSGRNYVVTTQGWGESDKVDGSVSHGRGRLPLDDAGLAAVAELLAKLAV